MLIQQTSLKIAKIFDDSYRIAQIIAVQRKIESDVCYFFLNSNSLCIIITISYVLRDDDGDDDDGDGDDDSI
jgi:hypothetical protein